MVRDPMAGPPGHSIFVMRALLIGFAMTYVAALYLDWHPSGLSVEATEYRESMILTMSGFSILFVLQKALWMLGIVLGALGIMLMCLRMRRGLPCVLWCPLPLVAAAFFGAAPSTYPATESTIVFVLWCASSALWGCAVVYGFLLRESLFLRSGH
jgi:hypothetical protein